MSDINLANYKPSVLADLDRQELIARFLSLITTIESQKEEIEAWERSEETLKRAFLVRENINEKKFHDKDKEIDSLKAITELAVKGLKEVQSKLTAYHPTVIHPIIAKTLSEIERLQNE